MTHSLYVYRNCLSLSYATPIYLFQTVILIIEQDAQPRTVIALWKAKIEEPKFQQKDPAVIILDQPTSNFLPMKLLSLDHL